jgi:hypothetical protein
MDRLGAPRSNLLVALDGLDHVEDSQIGAISRTEDEGARRSA